MTVSSSPAPAAAKSLPLEYASPHIAPVTSTDRRIKGLDVLRGIAAMSVVIYHYTSNYQRIYGHTSKPLFSFHYGALGVQLFFLISGFVIFMTLEKTRWPMDFVRSRFSRLYPTYWAAVLFTSAILLIFPLPGRTPNVPRIIVNLTMEQGLLGVQHVDPVYWTLQVELCFYTIMFVLFVAGQIRRAELWMLGLVALRIAEIHVIPSSLASTHPALARAIGWLEAALILDYATAFLIGMMLYKIWRDGPRVKYWSVLVVCLAVAFLYGPRDDFYFTLAFVALVYAGSQGYLRFLENPVLLFLGCISYSLYLTHQNLGYVLLRWAEGHGWNVNLAILAAMVLAIGVASVLTYGIERPALRHLRGKKSQRTG